jgi:Holliday junction resolvasome RuvABC endonuclease subunit
MSHVSRRILGVDPGTRHMGVAVLDARRILYGGVLEFTRHSPPDAVLQETRRALWRLIDRYHPAVLAYEKTFWTSSKRLALLHVQEAEIQRVGQMRKLKMAGYAPTKVRAIVCGDGRATKADVADILIERFPELKRYRRPEGYARYWLHMFDAIAVGVASAPETSRTTAARD